MNIHSAPRPAEKHPSPFLQGISFLIPVLLIAALPLLSQAVHYHGSDSIGWWLVHFRGAYYCNILVTGSIFLMLYPLVNSTYLASIGVTAIAFLLTIVDRQKMRILNQPLLPADLYFIRQTLTIAKLYAGPALRWILPAGLCFAVLYSLRRRVLHFSLPLPARITVAVIMIMSALLLHVRMPAVVKSLNHHFSLVDEYWNQLSNYRKNGLFYSFVMNMHSLGIPKPAGYNRSHVDALFSGWNNRDSAEHVPASPQHPDVIICLSESFWDISAISPVPLDFDPIPHFRELCTKGNSTRLVSPSFGGNTCNAEFEILTGLPHGFFPSGVMAYNQYISRPVPSLVQLFKESGYRATGIHTFKAWFWNRFNVYRHFGFDEFITDESMQHPEVKGLYISDNEFAHRIIAQASKSEKPDFIFAISMQNHGPYEKMRYASLEHHVATGLSEKADLEFNVFLQGLIDADRSLGMLRQYIDTVKTPTLLLFFGDHLPGFSYVYKETGALQKIHRDSLWGHTTTAVWYANYPLEALPDSLINMFYVPLMVTNEAHIPKPAYYRYLDSIRTVHPVLMVNTAAERERDSVPEAEDACRLCVYDLLFGKQFSAGYYRLPK